MSESLPPEKGANDRAFGVACWTLGGLAFVLLLMVGVSFSLSVRTVVVEKVVEKPVPVPGRTQIHRPGKERRRPNRSPQEIRVTQMAALSLRRGPGDSNPRA